MQKAPFGEPFGVVKLECRAQRVPHEREWETNRKVHQAIGTISFIRR